MILQQFQSCKPAWCDVKRGNVMNEWRKDWQSVSMVNQTLVLDHHVHISSHCTSLISCSPYRTSSRHDKDSVLLISFNAFWILPCDS